MQRDQLLAERYRLIERLGAGGMSTVWRAHDEVLERDVAVKVLTATDPGARWRIRSEAKAAARLAHPNLTRVYDYGESPHAGFDVPFVVMELLTGTTLARRLDRGPLPPEEALRVCADVAAGLATAHDQHLVHRDVKPENVMLTRTGAKILDFGIAAAVGAPEIDVQGRLLGTPAYTAPERLAAGEVLPAADVYALGLLIHHALVGRLPWPSHTRAGVPGADGYDEPGPLPEVDGVPPDVGRLYRRCLAQEPADRPTAGEAADILAAALVRVPTAESGRSGDRTPEAVRPPGPPHDPAAPAGPVRRPLPAPPEHRRSAPGRRAPYGARLLVTAAAAVLGAVAVAGTLGSPPSRRPGLAEEPGASRGSDERSSVALPVPPDPASTVAAPGASATTTAAATPTASAGRTPGVGPIPSGGTTGTPSTGAGSSTEVGARGGLVRVRCAGKKMAEVVDVVPATGYQLGSYDPGPAREAQVELVAADRSSVVTVRCANGRPVVRVKEQPPARPGAARG